MQEAAGGFLLLADHAQVPIAFWRPCGSQADLARVAIAFRRRCSTRACGASSA